MFLHFSYPNCTANYYTCISHYELFIMTIISHYELSLHSIIHVSLDVQWMEFAICFSSSEFSFLLRINNMYEHFLCEFNADLISLFEDWIQFLCPRNGIRGHLVFVLCVSVAKNF